MKDYAGHKTLRAFTSQFMATKKPAFREENTPSPFSPDVTMTPEEILGEMTKEEKLEYISGVENFCIKGIPRLGIPQVVTADATSGIRNIETEATILPCTEALAATFDRALAADYARVVAKDGRRAGVSVLLGPGVNIHRIPTCGRNFEYMGEDPYLAGEMAAAYIEAMNEEGMVTTVKHFACNNSDWNRNRDNAIVSRRALEEIYFPAFRKAIEAGTRGVMTSYNLVNGTHASENELLSDVLRKEWGFDGMVMSDWFSMYDTEAAVHHGVDIEMPGPLVFSREKLEALLQDGRITMEEIDEKVLHILTALSECGAFHRPVASGEEKDWEKDYAVALRTARKALVLLKNEGNLLPRKDLKNVVVLGYNAERTVTSGGGSCFIIPDRPIRKVSEVLEERGISVLTSSSSLWYQDEEIVRKVKEADLVLYATGYDDLIESEFYDRSYSLPNDDGKGIVEARKLNDRLLVVVNAGGDYEKSSWLSSAPALINAMYLGEASAEALTETILGENNPSGRQVFTMAPTFASYNTLAHYPSSYDEIDEYRQGMTVQTEESQNPLFDNPYEEGIYVGYRHFDKERKEVAFPFGHGLSYTTFTYSSLSLETEEGYLYVSLEVENTGSMDGDEVVQVYLHDKEAADKAVKELKGFERIHLRKGERKRVTSVIPVEELAYYDEEDGWTIDEHTYTVMVGSSSRDIRLEGDLRLALTW